MNKKVFSLLLSLIVSVFLVIKFSLEPIFSLLIFVIGFILIDYSLKHTKKKYTKISIITSIVLSIIYVICDSLEYSSFLAVIDKYLLLNLSSYFIIFYFSISNIFAFMDKYKKSIKEDRKIYISNKEIFTTSKFSFIVNFSLILIVNLLFLIKFYPGNLTYDSYNELMQAKGIIPLMNNHSILHTSVLMLFVKFGMLFKSINLGVFLYLLFQNALVSLVFSYILHFMAKEKIPVGIRIISLMFFAFHPINIFYSISVWKDVFFSICFAIFTILIYYYINNKYYFNNKKNTIIFMIISILLMYLRNNGIYIVIITYIVLFIINRKLYKKLLPIFLGTISIFFISRLILFNTLNIKDFEVKETLSVSSQAMARIYKYDKNKLTKGEIKEIENYYSDKIGDVYNPKISDDTKNLLNEKYFKKHKSEYFKLNTKLFFKHNKTYVEAFLNNNYGYYYMNTYYPSIMLQKTDELGVKHAYVDSLFILLFLVLIGLLLLLTVLWNLEEKKNILLLGLLLPVLISIPSKIQYNSLIQLLFNIGFYVTIVFVTLLYNIKNKKNIVHYIPIIILTVSMLFAPVYAEFRYLYPLFILVPIFIGLTLKKTDE